jgi:flavin reductase (DIM6/NTAB) family NADH-FMN oxidoreductase RutF
MRLYKKRARPVSDIRRVLEPGPVILVSSAWKGKQNIMTMGWHMMLADEPTMVGCYVWTEDYSRQMIRKSKECVINIPTADMAETVVDIGNSTGAEIDKFATFGLTAVPASKVSAPLIGECYASYECKLVDESLIRKYSLFVFEVVKAHVASSPKYPRTIHYRGQGVFMVSGENTAKYRRRFAPDRL